jgi:hypothetical protein
MTIEICKVCNRRMDTEYEDDDICVMCKEQEDG